MKLFLISFAVILCVVAVNSAERDNQFLEYLKECKASTNASDDDVKQLTMRQRLTTKSAQCLMACIKKKTMVMNADNSMNMDKLKDRLAPLKAQNPEMYEKIVKLMQTCKDEQTPEKDECVAAKKFSDCVMDKRSQAGLP